MARGQQHKFHAMIAAEEEEWEERRKNERLKKEGGDTGGTSGGGMEGIQTFEEYRQRAKSAGFV